MELQTQTSSPEVQPTVSQEPVQVTQPVSQPEATPVAQPVNVQPVAPTGKKKLPIWVWFLVGGCGCLVIFGALFIAFGAALLGIAINKTDTAKTLVTQMCTDIKSGTSTKNLFSSAATSSANFDDGILQVEDLMKNCQGIDSITNINASTDNGKELISVDGTLKYSDGTPAKNIQLDVVKEGNDYRIQYIKVS